MSKFTRMAALAALANLNVLRVSGVVSDGETIVATLNNQTITLEFDTNGAYTAGRLIADVSAGGVKASGTLTLTQNAADTNTVTIGSQVYTYQTTLTNVANNVLIGADASASLDNLIAAINRSAGAGTLYATATVAHPQVTAAAGTGDTMDVTARVNGTAANAYSTVDSLAGSSAFGATTLANGAQPTAAQGVDAIVAAWNAGQGQFQAIKISTSEILFVDSDGGVTYGAFTETMANGAFAQAAAYRGRGPLVDRTTPLVSFVPLALEVTLGNLHVVFPFTPTAVMVMVRVTATGVIKQWGGTIAQTAGRVTLTNNASVDWAATDTVTVIATP